MKPAINTAIKNDASPQVFEALLADMRKFMEQLKRTGYLDVLSVQLQDDAAVFFSRKRLLTEDGSKNALQMIINILKN